MGLIQFVGNYEDASTDKGYQFRFFCDKCRNGYMSRFTTSKVGLAGSVLRAAGGLFGGWVSSAGSSSYDLQRMVGGPEHDAALREAVEEGKKHFHQCTKCGKWVCPEVCWNAKANLCEECAPDFHESLVSNQAHAKAEAARQQLAERALKTDSASDVDMSADASLRAADASPAAPSTPVCRHCGADLGSAKFCPECGKPTAVQKRFCPQCGEQVAPNAKFCGGCGTPMKG